MKLLEIKRKQGKIREKLIFPQKTDQSLSMTDWSKDLRPNKSCFTLLTTFVLKNLIGSVWAFYEIELKSCNHWNHHNLKKFTWLKINSKSWNLICVKPPACFSHNFYLCFASKPISTSTQRLNKHLNRRIFK